jgi:hypothetical protein
VQEDYTPTADYANNLQEQPRLLTLWEMITIQVLTTVQDFSIGKASSTTVVTARCSIYLYRFSTNSATVSVTGAGGLTTDC